MSLAMLTRKRESNGPSKAPAPSVTNGLRIGASDSMLEREADRIADDRFAEDPRFDRQPGPEPVFRLPDFV